MSRRPVSIRLSRRQFWELIDRIRERRPQMSVLVATAYMEEAEQFDWLVAMDDGKVIATGTPAEVRAHAGAETLEAAFIALLPEEKRKAHKALRSRLVCRSQDPGDRSRRAHQALWLLHRRRSRELPHRERRDLRLSRLQWLRQDPRR